MIHCNVGLEIVNRAVLDWRLLIRAKAWKRKKLYQVTNADRLPHRYCNFEELRRFFESEWCDTILVSTGASITSEKILRVLERELEKAIEKDKEREARKA